MAKLWVNAQQGLIHFKFTQEDKKPENFKLLRDLDEVPRTYAEADAMIEGAYPATERRKVTK